MSNALNQTAGAERMEQPASMSTPMALPHGLMPTPQLDASVPELPVLENAPHTYKVGDAIVELLNPEKSLWARQPHLVKEIQDRLVQLGVRGVSDIQSFDGAMRHLLKQGKVRREKNVEGKYQYYLVQGA